MKKLTKLQQIEIGVSILKLRDELLNKSTDEKRRQRRLQNQKDIEPILQDLKKAGFEIIWQIAELKRDPRYLEAVPIFLSWFSKIDNLDIKKSIIHTLADKRIQAQVQPLFLKEFYAIGSTPDNASLEDYKWLLGDSLREVADDNIFEDIKNIVLDRRHGSARAMPVHGLAKMKNPQAVDVLIDLLKDDQMRPLALCVLRKLRGRAEKARVYVEPYLNDKDPSIRKEAEKLMEVLDKYKNK